MLIIDKIITDPNDELYDLQEKYNVKINRSCSSDAVYIFKNRTNFTVRVGHPIPKSMKHIRNFAINVGNAKSYERFCREDDSKVFKQILTI